MAVERYKDTRKLFRALGKSIKDLRTKAGLTQEDMLDRGFSVRYYQRIEGGKPIHLKTVLKLADVFGVSLGNLFKRL